MEVSIRLLKEQDAKTSYLWRNDPEIWKYTGFNLPPIITLESERDWIKTVLKRKNEVRFAICAGNKKKYVGNVQLTSITGLDAEFHIFIGMKSFHGKGIGTKATLLILDFALVELKLQEVYLFVKKDNIGAIKSYYKCGFYEIENNQEQIKLIKKFKSE